MKIEENILLKNHTTLRLGGPARFFATIFDQLDILEAVDFARIHNLPVVPLGGGSNIVVRDILPDMLVLKMENKNIEIISENFETTTIRVSAGFVWDDFIEYTVTRRLSGLEALSMIPGTCGASPVQNVGAYGAEVADVIRSVRVCDMQTDKWKDINANDCNFSYRDSIFKKKLKGKCVIESVVFELKKTDPIVPSYPRVSEVLEEIKKQNPDDFPNILIRKTIQKIRSEKLPDPKIVPSVGSFFKNSFVEKEKLAEMLRKFPDILFFPFGDKFKIPAGWLIEKSGLKGFSLAGASVYQKNALVLTNDSATSADAILKLAEVVQNTVADKFGVWLEIEPEIL